MATVNATRSVNWAWLWALLVYWTYKVTLMAAMLVIYVGFIADGLRRSYSMFGQKLWRIVPPLRDFEATYRMDLALVAAVIMAFLVCVAWSYLIEAWLNEGEYRMPRREEKKAALALMLGVVILLGDATLFYQSCLQAGWADTTFSIGALIATSVYAAAVILVNLIGVNLKNNMKEAGNQ